MNVQCQAASLVSCKSSLAILSRITHALPQETARDLQPPNSTHSPRYGRLCVESRGLQRKTPENKRLKVCRDRSRFFSPFLLQIAPQYCKTRVLGVCYTLHSEIIVCAKEVFRNYFPRGCAKLLHSIMQNNSLGIILGGMGDFGVVGRKHDLRDRSIKEVRHQRV